MPALALAPAIRDAIVAVLKDKPHPPPDTQTPWTPGNLYQAILDDHGVSPVFALGHSHNKLYVINLHQSKHQLLTNAPKQLA